MILLLLIMLAIAAIQVPQLVSRRQWGELAVFVLIWVAATAYSLLVAADMQIANPTEIISGIITRLLPLPDVLTPP